MRKQSVVHAMREVVTGRGPLGENEGQDRLPRRQGRNRAAKWSPNVAGSTKRLSAGTSPGSFSQTARRPPPARRTCPFGSGAASRSSSPRLIVERASPVIFDTAARPPQPALRTSPAANNRRPRSSSFEPTVSHRCRIAFSSIIRPTYACSPAPESPTPKSLRRTPADRNLVLFGVSLAAK